MNTEYKCVTTVEGIKEYIGDSPLVAFDFETAPDDSFRDEDKAALDPAKAHIVGCSFSVKEGTGMHNISLGGLQETLSLPHIVWDVIAVHTQGQIFLGNPEIRQNNVFIFFIKRRKNKHERGYIRC